MVYTHFTDKTVAQVRKGGGKERRKTHLKGRSSPSARNRAQIT